MTPVGIEAGARFVCLLGLVAVLAAALPAAAVAETHAHPAAQLATGGHHTCAVLAGASVRCFGFAHEGQLGYGNQETIGDDETAGAAGPVDLGTGRTAESISAGRFHTCAVLDDASIRCWGFGGNGRLGYASLNNIGDDESPASVGPVGLGSPAVAVSAGGAHTCALLGGGEVRCWGHGFLGALGGGGDPNSLIADEHPPDIGDDETPASVGPVNFGAGRTAQAVTAGGYHTCALLGGGEVRCWGYGANGQLGYPKSPHQTAPMSVSDPSTVAAVNLGEGRTAVGITAGELHTCALLDDASVRCWGVGLDGQLGSGTVTSVGDDEHPGDVPPVDLGGRAVAISAGEKHTCALLEDSSVRCWGRGDDGRLGYAGTATIGDDEAPGPVGPVALGASRRSVAISAGGRHTCARLDDGSVSCWGYGGNGRLGYCNERNVGDNEAPATAGAVPLELAVSAPSIAYPGCARPPAPAGPAPLAAPDAAPPPLAAPDAAPPPPLAAPAPRAAAPLVSEAARRRKYRACLRRAAAHAAREQGGARRSSGSQRAHLRRHAKRHRAKLRRDCLRRHGRAPGRVTALKARALSRTTIALTFKAPGSDGARPPAARSYLVKQSRRPIRSRRAFRRAETLCSGRCRFPAIQDVGADVRLTVKDLRSRTTYYYAVAARDNVSGRLGPRSDSAKARTP